VIPPPPAAHVAHACRAGRLVRRGELKLAELRQPVRSRRCTPGPGARVGQREDEQRAAERRVPGEILVPAHGAQPLGLSGQPGRHAYAGPAADTRIDADVLLALILVRKHVADDSGGRLELPKLFAVLGAHRLDIALERAVEHDVARGRERAGPYREALGPGPDDLALGRVPGDEVAHAAVAAWRRVHRESGAHVRLTGRVFDLERLVRHAYVIGGHHEQARLAVVACRLLILRAECGWADVLDVDVRSCGPRRVLLVHHRPPGLHVDLGRPIHFRIVLFG